MLKVPFFVCETLLFKVQGRYVPADEPIDLLNVGFENPRKQGEKHNPNRKKKRKSDVEDYPREGQGIASDRAPSCLVPDRETGLEGVAELRRLCPHRTWNFVSTDEILPAVIRY